MIFTSYTYFLFLTAAFVGYWLLPSRLRNGALVALSYLFYCSWKWQYGFLLLAVSLFTFLYGHLLHRHQGNGHLLALGVAAEILPLLYFKYSGFLVSNAASVVGLWGLEWHPRLPDILLPLGISFFTFQGVAYLVDVAAGEVPFEHLTGFMLFKAFWPQLIAGPIIRPGEIRDQIQGARSIDYGDVAEGTRRIVQGCFKKVVLADTLAPIVDSVFLKGARPAAVDTIAATLGFGLQVYFDFSAYSDIAIGSARLFGFRFPENFSLPYGSRSPQEFWNRWHQSLSRWIRDYVFTPLTFSTRRSPGLALLWLVVAMAICGLWHGAQWTFVAWGIWHGILLVVSQTWLKPLFAPSGQRGRVLGGFAWATTFCLVMLGWLLFRAQTLSQAWDLVTTIVAMRGGLRPTVLRENAVLVIAAIGVALLLYQESVSLRAQLSSVVYRNHLPWPWVRALYYAGLIVAVVVFDKEAMAFVYFQF
jgi:D-alanyl-lipoteichoic acid acyltransferase DltB (MBOAT superfamily)